MRLRRCDTSGSGLVGNPNSSSGSEEEEILLLVLILLLLLLLDLPKDPAFFLKMGGGIDNGIVSDKDTSRYDLIYSRVEVYPFRPLLPDNSIRLLTASRYCSIGFP